MTNELTTYQIYLILLGYLVEQVEHDDAEMLKPILTELYRRAESEDKDVQDTPQTKMGRWIYGEDNLGTGRDGWYCNQCGHFEFWDYSSDMKSAKLNLPNPCPNCGAKMVEL